MGRGLLWLNPQLLYLMQRVLKPTSRARSPPPPQRTGWTGDVEGGQDLKVLAPKSP